MAKAREIEGLNCNDDALENAAKVLRVRFDEVIAWREKALDFSDIKGVHDMRVATRRLRSALRDFAPLLKKSPLTQVKIDLKNLADALGAVRDLDVEITALENLQAETEHLKEGIEEFMQARRHLREITQSDLSSLLTVEKINDLQKEFTTALDKAADSETGRQTISFKNFGREVITANLREFCDLSSFLYEPFNVYQLHKLRISAKRLRYAIQLFAPCWDAELKLFAKEISAMQTFLGDTHDYDVWIEGLGKHLQVNSVNSNNRQTAIWLLSEFIGKRNKEYISAVKLHNEWKSNYFIARFKAMIL